MNAEQLYVKNKEGGFKETDRWFCTKCRCIGIDYSRLKSSKEIAEKCCQAVFCECGAELKSRSWTRCQDCRNKDYRAKELERYKKATRVNLEDYKEEMVYTSKGEYLSIDCVFDNYTDDELNDVMFFGVSKKYLPRIDFVTDYEERLLDDFSDEGGELLVTLTAGLKEFQEAQGKLYEANADKFCYEVNESIVVIFPTERK